MDFKKINWRWWLDIELSEVLGEDLEQIKKEVEQDICQLYMIKNHGLLIVRREFENSEFVFVAGTGKNAISVIKHFREIAKKEGFKKMRIHSKRKGMGRYLKQVGFVEVENRGYEKVFKGVI